MWTRRDVMADRCNPIFRSYVRVYQAAIDQSPASERARGLAGGRKALADWDSVIADSPRTASRPTMYGQSPGRQLGELFKGKACELRDAGRQRLIEYHTLVDWP